MHFASVATWPSKVCRIMSKGVDDILVYDQDFSTHLQRIHKRLTRCRKSGITLNRDKFVVATPSATICGYTLSREGISADRDKVSEIRDFPTPTNLTDLRSVLGLVNQLAKFIPDIAAAAQPLHPLMSPKRAFAWTTDHQEAFRRVKAALISPPVLAPFDSAMPVIGLQPRGLRVDEAGTNNFTLRHMEDHQEPTEMVICRVPPVACFKGPPMNRPKNGSEIDE